MATAPAPPTGTLPAGSTSPTVSNPWGLATPSAPTGVLSAGAPPPPAPSNPWDVATPVVPAAAPTGLQPGTGNPSDVGFNGNVPGTGENVANSYLNYYGANGTPSAAQNAQGAYNAFQQSTPVDMSGYYDNAQRLQDNSINTQMAARGSYGSSNAVGTLAAADTNLRAQQANAEGQYQLQRAGLAGTLASGADASSVAGSNNDLNWMGGLSQLGFQAQKEGTARYELGNQDALTAANTMSNIQGSVGNQEIQSQYNDLVQQLTAQGMTAGDASTAAQNQLSRSDAQDDAAATTAVSAMAYFV